MITLNTISETEFSKKLELIISTNSKSNYALDYQFIQDMGFDFENVSSFDFSEDKFEMHFEFELYSEEDLKKMRFLISQKYFC